MALVRRLNRYLFSNLYSWEQEHDIKIKWHFFATSHGKGVVDGIGGTVKRSVWRRVRSGKAHITNPAEYAEVAKDRNPVIYIQFITKDGTDAMNYFLDTKWEGVKAVPQPHKIHCFIPKSSDEIMVVETSDTTQFKGGHT